MPIGLWHVSQVTPPLESLRHKAILFCPPDTEVFRWAKSNGVLNCGRCPGDYTPLLKEVVGLPGDVVEFDGSRVYINGQVLARSEIYWLGMNSLEISHVIKAGSIWVVGTGSNRSFDSRYFGDISITNISGVAEPILVLERE
jgi:conjugative transfer signal peptidase TraF